MSRRTPRRVLPTPIIMGTYALIPLADGQSAIVDTADLPLVQEFFWRARTDRLTQYALSPTGRLMHRLIMGAAPPGYPIIDHINDNGLDNRRANLRWVTNKENSARMRKRANTSSKYRGVSFHKDRQKWQAVIRSDTGNDYLGIFESEEAAARTYDAIARQRFGKFASSKLPGLCLT